MKEINVMTIGGIVTLAPGDKFQAYVAARGNGKRQPCLYQFLGLNQANGVMESKPIYLHDETHDTFCDVSYGWFALKLILVLKEEEV